MLASSPIFMWGMLGSVAVELALVLRCYERGGRFPSRFKRKGFWCLRIIFAAVSGMVAVAYGVNNPIVAFHIGVATPVILSTMAKTDPRPGPPGTE